MDMINPISPRQSNRVSDYFCNPREALRRLDKSRPRDGEPRVRAGPDDYLRVLLAHRHKQAINSRLPTWSIDIILIKYPYIFNTISAWALCGCERPTHNSCQERKVCETHGLSWTAVLRYRSQIV